MGNNNDETESMQLNTHRLKKERKKKNTPQLIQRVRKGGMRG